MKRDFDLKKFISKNSIYLVLIVLVVVLSFAEKTFLTPLNITNLFTAEAIKGILTLGVMFCILSKGIDLSLGSVLALSAVVSASMIQEASYAAKMFPNMPEFPVIVAVIAGLLAGTIFGVANGLLIAYTKIPAFIATLGSMIIARGLAQLYTNAYPVPMLKPGFKAIGQGSLLFGIPNVVTIFILFILAAWYMLEQTKFGKNVYAIGGNEVAAKVAGINVEKNIVAIYTWSAFCASMGGILIAARSGSGNSTQGMSYELDAIAAATVGGMSHSGGIGRVGGVFAGILILGVINNGLLLMGVSPYLQQIVKGLIIVCAVVFDMRKNAKKA